MLTNEPGGGQRQLDALVATGTEVELRTPDPVDPVELMSPASVPKAMAMGARQAAGDLAVLTKFWG